MPAREAGWEIEATMGVFFPDGVLSGPNVEDPLEHAREFHLAHSEMLLHPTNLISRLTLQARQDAPLAVERHMMAEAFPWTISLGFVVKEGGNQLGWIISNRANRYDVSLGPDGTTMTLYERNNQNSLLRRKELCSAAAQCAVQNAAMYLVSLPETQEVITDLQGGSERSRQAVDEIKHKQARNESLTKPERDVLKAYQPHGFPVGPWTSMEGKTPLVSG